MHFFDYFTANVFITLVLATLLIVSLLQKNIMLPGHIHVIQRDVEPIKYWLTISVWFMIFLVGVFFSYRDLSRMF